jgi:glycogen debranching enzyme
MRDTRFSDELTTRADELKKKFNESFVLEGRRGNTSLAFALDGTGRPLTAARSSMGHCLWAVWRSERGAMPESIIDEKYRAPIARRLLKPDLYVPRAGIRTLSQKSSRYDPHSYHNGSIWPHDTAIVAEGLDTFGFREEAKRMRHGLLAAYSHFNTPLELFVYTRGRYREYVDSRGQGACRVQAWSAASLLSLSLEISEVSRTLQ